MKKQKSMKEEYFDILKDDEQYATTISIKPIKDDSIPAMIVFSDSTCFKEIILCSDVIIILTFWRSYFLLT